MSIPDFAQAAVPYISGGAVAAIVSALFQRRKTSAEADSIILNNAAILTGILQKEVQRLNNRMIQMESELRSLLKDNRKLHQEVSRLSAENIILKEHLSIAEANTDGEE